MSLTDMLHHAITLYCFFLNELIMGNLPAWFANTMLDDIPAVLHSIAHLPSASDGILMKIFITFLLVCWVMAPFPGLSGTANNPPVPRTYCPGIHILCHLSRAHDGISDNFITISWAGCKCKLRGWEAVEQTQLHFLVHTSDHNIKIL